MTKKIWTMMGAAMVVGVGALFLAACGGDDNSSSSTATTSPSTASTPTSSSASGNANTTSSPTAASSTSSSSSSSDPADGAYVTAMCKAQLDFITVFNTITADDAANQAKADTAIAGLGAAVNQMKPPSDGKAYQDQVVKFLADARQTIKDKGLTGLSSLTPPEPPAGASKRLDALGAKDKNCTAAHFTFSNN